MFTHISLNAHVVWDDILWTVVAIWQDDDVSEPVALERSGQCPMYDQGSVGSVLQAAVDALERSALERGHE